ncbi:MAG: hypothetical protein ABGW50_02085 [Thermococcus sp.]
MVVYANKLTKLVDFAQSFSQTSIAQLLDSYLQDAGLSDVALIKEVIPTECSAKTELECSSFAAYAILNIDDTRVAYIPIWNSISDIIAALASSKQAGASFAIVDNIVKPETAKTLVGAIAALVYVAGKYVQVKPMASYNDVAVQVAKYLENKVASKAAMIFKL